MAKNPLADHPDYDGENPDVQHTPAANAGGAPEIAPAGKPTPGGPQDPSGTRLDPFDFDAGRSDAGNVAPEDHLAKHPVDTRPTAEPTAKAAAEMPPSSPTAELADKAEVARDVAAAPEAKPPAENVVKETATKGEAAAVKDAEGFWARQFSTIKRNFGGEAWKEMPWKTGFRTGGTVVGLGMVADASFRSQSNDEPRSAAARVGEGTAGGVIALISALVGGRGK